MRKIPRTAKLDEAVRPSQILAVRGIFLNPIISKLGKHVVLLRLIILFMRYELKNCNVNFAMNQLVYCMNINTQNVIEHKFFAIGFKHRWYFNDVK